MVTKLVTVIPQVSIAYVNTLVNTRDQWHDAAIQWEQKLVADNRRLITTLQASPLVAIVPTSSQLFVAALALYRSQADKDWRLTDCASCVVMSEHGLSESLTTDDHVRQTGFRALLLENMADQP